MNDLKILAFQPLINRVTSIDDRRSHVQNMIRTLEPICRREPDIALVLLPELSTIEYSAASFAKLADFAEPIEGETFTAVSSLAKRMGCAISYGVPQVIDGRYFISQVVVGPSGRRLATYNKIHLAQFGVCSEQDYFSCGDTLSVFELGGFRFGTVICYDFRFSDLIKELALTHEVDVILHPVAFAQDISFRSWHHFVIARALEYQVYFLSINRAGQMYGRSILCPPWVDHQSGPLILGEAEETCVFTLDMQMIRFVRETIPFRKDRLANYSLLGTG